MNIEFYTRDAREAFLAPESVDLFVTHPPYFKSHMEEYGAAELQLGNTQEHEIFVKNLIDVIKHMEKALKPTGLISIVLPNNETPSSLIGEISRNTRLSFAPMRFWRNPYAIKDTCMILFLYKDVPYENIEYMINSDVIDIPWKNELSEYASMGFVNDAFPEELCNVLIQRYSREGDVVADLLAGTGTLQVSAMKLGRHAIYNDASEEQTNIAKARIAALNF
jgi:DNA modification methylase